MSEKNANSLANLMKPKSKKPGHGYQYKISHAKIDELFSYLAGGMSLSKAAKESHICFDTARRYYKEGDPKRGIQPIVNRVSIFQARISEKMNVLLEEQRMERLTIIRNLIKRVQDSLFLDRKFYDKDGKEIEVYDEKGVKIQMLDPTKVSARDLERLMKLEIFVAGGVKTKEVEATGLTADELSGASVDEL